MLLPCHSVRFLMDLTINMRINHGFNRTLFGDLSNHVVANP